MSVEYTATNGASITHTHTHIHKAQRSLWKRGQEDCKIQGLGSSSMHIWAVQIVLFYNKKRGHHVGRI